MANANATAPITAGPVATTAITTANRAISARPPHGVAAEQGVEVQLLAAALVGMQAAGHLVDLLATAPEVAKAEEGWILGLGAEDSLTRALLSPSGRAAAGLGSAPMTCEDTVND